MSVALVIQHAMCMHHILLPSVAHLALPYFSTLPHKQHNFQKKGIEHEICVSIFATIWYEIFLILRRNE